MDLFGLNGTESSSENFGLGFGSTSGKSHEESGSSQSSENESWNTSSSDSWARTYGEKASAEDIARAKEANDLQYQWWKESLDYNMSEAEKQRAWQERMSNTAYQRAVDDMIKAGLNPVLAAMNGGSSTPSGAAASTSGASVAKAQTFPEQKSKSHSESSGGSYGYGSGSSWSVGDSTQNGININLNSGQSKSQSGVDVVANRVGGTIANSLNKTIGKIFGSSNKNETNVNGFKSGGGGTKF